MTIRVLAKTLIILFSICCAKRNRTRSSRARWTGSRLGTNLYSHESHLIDIAKNEDVRKRSTRNKKDLLCASFVMGAFKSALTLLGNVDNGDVVCDWAVVVYDGDASEVCNPLRLKSNVVHCQLIPEESFRGIGMFGYANASSLPLLVDKVTGRPRRPTIPKTILYTELVPLLKNYHRVILLDEDISLEGFATERFLRIWSCAFYPHVPLVVQPLIAENTQFLQYMNAKSWKKIGLKDVLASASGVVEQQVPAFDAIFFEWLVQHIFSIPRPVVLQNGVDWGHDRTWCNAAQMYASQILHWPLQGMPLIDPVDGSETLLSACAILTGAAPVHHLNTRSMTSKRTQRERYRLGGRVVVQEYINLFPTWVLLDISRGPDPTNQQKFKKVKKLVC